MPHSALCQTFEFRHDAITLQVQSKTAPHPSDLLSQSLPSLRLRPQKTNLQNPEHRRSLDLSVAQPPSSNSEEVATSEGSRGATPRQQTVDSGCLARQLEATRTGVPLRRHDSQDSILVSKLLFTCALKRVTSSFRSCCSRHRVWTARPRVDRDVDDARSPTRNKARASPVLMAPLHLVTLPTSKKQVRGCIEY